MLGLHAALPGQSLVGAVPSGKLPHTPVPATQALQLPQSLTVQHTLSVQKLLVHSLLPPQPAPLPFFGTHAVPAQ